MPVKPKKVPVRRSREARDLRDAGYHQRIVPDKREAARAKAQEIDMAWEQHARDIERGDV